MHYSSTCHKVMGIIRILLGLFMIYMGVMKLLAPVEMHAAIGSAAHGLGLTFLSTEVWFWIATIGELVAGLLLVTGHWYKIGAILTLIIMVFAINHMGLGLNPILVTVGSIAVLIWGAGARRLCHGKCCEGSDGHDHCCGHCMGSKNGKCSCGPEHHQHIHQQQ